MRGIKPPVRVIRSGCSSRYGGTSHIISQSSHEDPGPPPPFWEALGEARLEPQPPAPPGAALCLLVSEIIVRAGLPVTSMCGRHIRYTDRRTTSGCFCAAPVINRFTRRASVCAEAYNPDEEDDDTETRVIHPKTDDQRNRLQEACKDILLFKSLDQEQMSQVLDAMFEKLVKCGEHIIDQGDDGDNFYVIDRGTYDIYVKIDGVGRCVGTYDNHGSFGELALMYNTPRAATIVATSVGAIWCLDRATFRRIIVKNNARKRRMYENFIESLPFLKSLELSERLKVVDVIGTKMYRDGEQIIAQGDGAESFFIVETGEVRIAMKSKSKQDAEVNEAVEIARCSRGQYFGELALVTNKPRAASAYAVGNVKCLVMDVQAFERLLGPCMEIMKRNIANYEEQLVALFGTNMDITDSNA
ncbi:cAMP-dependent kinase type II-beta regulatory subunit [Pelobates cultripes]|uniref:cAMP-dependent kinase type II-beta regulatory subunit n=1 Tax=Pelobates cultripes TaxID=61616 RepID=A0AAD1RPR5_PELCU|nr:cAMP-dependent kinase type II-beta regulatory subunit [Pelobates cultripes]